MNKLKYGLVEALTVLQRHSRHSYPDVSLASRVRFVYWANGPVGNIGVSFVDPVSIVSKSSGSSGGTDVVPNGFLDSECETYKRLQCGIEKEIRISADSPDELGRSLSVESIKPYEGLAEAWRQCYNKEGSEAEPILISWTKSRKCSDESSYYDDEESYYDSCSHESKLIVEYSVDNDYTIRPFNFLYIKKLLENKELVDAIKAHRCYSDGRWVSEAYGYASPAYAVSLFLSLNRYGFLGAAMRSYRAFLQFHPKDPITDMCEKVARERFKNVLCDYSGEDPVEWERRNEQEMRMEGNWDTDDRQEEAAYYVEGEPIYEASSQEEANEIYWNTH